MPFRTVLERGPKGKGAVAFAVDWPGWSRGAKTPELALEVLESYRERYRPVPVLYVQRRPTDLRWIKIAEQCGVVLAWPDRLVSIPGIGTV